MEPDKLNLLNHMIASPNTNTIVSMLNESFYNSKPIAAGFKIMHVGIDKLPVIILDIDPINGNSWQKRSCFDSLTNGMRSHMNNLRIPDLATVVSTELPLDTTTTFVEATDILKRHSHEYF